MRSSAESTDNSALLFILFLFNGPILLPSNNFQPPNTFIRSLVWSIHVLGLIDQVLSHSGGTSEQLIVDVFG